MKNSTAILARTSATPRMSITETLAWQRAMTAYGEACITFDTTEEDTPEAEAAENAMAKAYEKVKRITKRCYA